MVKNAVKKCWEPNLSNYIEIASDKVKLSTAVYHLTVDCNIASLRTALLQDVSKVWVKVGEHVCSF